MTTLNHEVWANPTTPLFLQSGASANNTAPLSLGSTPLPSTQRTTITSTATNGGIYYGANSGTQTQAYGELSFSNAGGWALKTNNITQLAGSSADGGSVTSSVPIVVSDPKTSTALEITTNSIGATPNNPATTIVIGASSINIGQGVVASDGTGLLVQDSAGTSVGVYAPLTTAYATRTLTPSTTTYTFAGTSLPPAPSAYIQTATQSGFVMSSDQAGAGFFGVTNTTPSQSPVAVSTGGTPPSSSIGLFLATAKNILWGSEYVEFPPIVSTAGTSISITWKQAGRYTYGALYKNDVLYADLTSYSSSTWVSMPTYTFTSTGDDRIYIEINNKLDTGPNIYIYYNISDIAITTSTPTTTTNGVMGMNGSAIRMTNGTSGSYVEADSIAGGASLVSSVANGTSVVLSNNINLTAGSGGAITLNSTTNGVNVNGALNMGGNSVTNANTITGTYIVGTSNVSTPALDNPTAVLDIGVGSSSVNLYRGSNVNTLLLDGVAGGNLYIGNNSSSVSASNVYAINCVPVSSGAGVMTNMRTINNSPACAGAVIQFLNNIGGYHIGSLYIPPKPVARIYNNYIFGNSWVGNEFINNQGITIPPYSVFTYSNTGGSQVVYSNATSTGYFQADTGFLPSSSTQVYTLTPILV